MSEKSEKIDAAAELSEEPKRSHSLTEKAKDTWSGVTEKTSELAHGAGEAIKTAFESTKDAVNRLLSTEPEKTNPEETTHPAEEQKTE